MNNIEDFQKIENKNEELIVTNDINIKNKIDNKIIKEVKKELKIYTKCK